MLLLLPPTPRRKELICSVQNSVSETKQISSAELLLLLLTFDLSTVTSRDRAAVSSLGHSTIVTSLSLPDADLL